MYITYPYLQGAVKDGTLYADNKNVTGRFRFPALPALLFLLLTAFLFSGRVLQRWDPAAAVLDTGILSVLLFAVLSAFVSIYCSIWLQEILWKPFRYFRKQFVNHFNELTSWQKCTLYFSVFFLLLYAFLLGWAIVF